MANNLWGGAVRQGLDADRPTVPDFPSDTFGFYFSTDTGILWFGYSGASWEQAGVPAAEAAASFTGEAGVTATSQPMTVQKLTLALTDVVADVADADDFGSAALVTLPDTNMLILGCEVDLTLTKDGTGFIAATDLDVALGTAAASNTTLASTMLNVLPKQDVDADSLTPALAAHSLATTPVLTGVLDGAANVLYFNVSGPTETSEDATVTVDGTITLFYVDLGNETS